MNVAIRGLLFILRRGTFPFCILIVRAFCTPYALLHACCTEEPIRRDLDMHDMYTSGCASEAQNKHSPDMEAIHITWHTCTSSNDSVRPPSPNTEFPSLSSCDARVLCDRFLTRSTTHSARSPQSPGRYPRPATPAISSFHAGLVQESRHRK